MVKTTDRKKTTREQEEKTVRIGKGNNDREMRITAETHYGECRERLTAFGGGGIGEIFGPDRI